MVSSKTEQYKKIIVPIIIKHLPNVKILLYGSRARGDDRAGSDLDIALDNASKIDRQTLTTIYFDLSDSDLPIKFDLVDFHVVSEKMQDAIKRDGVLWQR